MNYGEGIVNFKLLFCEYYPHYFTAPLLELNLLKKDKYKDLIISGMKFLVKENRVLVYGFYLMSNHIHLLCLLRQICVGR